jgi:hypothetical protein
MISPARPVSGRGAGGGLVAAGALAAGLAAGGGSIALGTPVPLLVALAGLTGLALVILSPDWALAALAAFVVLRFAEIATDFHGVPSLFQPLTGAVLLGVAARWGLTGTRPPPVSRAGLLVGAYLLVAVGSLAFAAHPTDPIGTGLGLIKDAGVALLAGLLLTRAASLRILLWSMVAAGGALAAISVFQSITGSFGSSFLGFGQSSVENIVGTFDDIRISGPIGDPNYYGQLLVVIFPLALDRMWSEQSALLRLAAGGAAALVAAAAVLTFSRGAALAVMVVLVMMAVVHRPGLKAVAAVTLAAVLALPLLPDGYLERLTTLGDVGTVTGSTDVSIRGRTAEVTAAWLMLRDRPLTGVGFGQFAHRYQDYVAGLGIELRSREREAHSLYLEVAAETGLPGIAAMGALLVGAFASLTRGRRRFAAAGLDDEARITAALTAALTGFMVTALFLHLDFARLFWLLIGVCLAIPALADRAAAARQGATR